MLELLMGGIYHVRRLDGLIWHEMHTKSHKNWQSHSSNIKVLPQKFERL
jgi:hypothetical protein